MRKLYKQQGGLLTGAKSALSGVENKMYKDALSKGNKRLISYFEDKINKKINEQHKDNQTEIERYSELAGRDNRDGTSMVDTYSDYSSLRQYIPFYNTVFNSPKMIYSDVKEAIIGNAQKTEDDVKQRPDNLRDIYDKSVAIRRKKESDTNRNTNLSLAAQESIEPLMDIVGTGATSKMVPKRLYKKGLSKLADFEPNINKRISKADIASDDLTEKIDEFTYNFVNNRFNTSRINNLADEQVIVNDIEKLYTDVFRSIPLKDQNVKDLGKQLELKLSTKLANPEYKHLSKYLDNSKSLNTHILRAAGDKPFVDKTIEKLKEPLENIFDELSQKNIKVDEKELEDMINKNISDKNYDFNVIVEKLPSGDLRVGTSTGGYIRLEKHNPSLLRYIKPSIARGYGSNKGLIKKLDYPELQEHYGGAATVHNSINDYLKQRKYGNLLSSGAHSEDGKTRWEKLVKKGIADIINEDLELYKLKKKGGKL
jgi:hypothetical protein